MILKSSVGQLLEMLTTKFWHSSSAWMKYTMFSIRNGFAGDVEATRTADRCSLYVQKSKAKVNAVWEKVNSSSLSKQADEKMTSFSLFQ